MMNGNLGNKKAKVDLRKNYEDLANAIVLQACIDYQWLRGKTSRVAEVRRKSVTDFFHSELFGLITDIEPNALIKRLENGKKIESEVGLI